jgi:hypothetical protein
LPTRFDQPAPARFRRTDAETLSVFVVSLGHPLWRCCARMVLASIGSWSRRCPGPLQYFELPWIRCTIGGSLRDDAKRRGDGDRSGAYDFHSPEHDSPQPP